MTDPYRSAGRTRWKVRIVSEKYPTLLDAENKLSKLLENGYCIAGQSEGDNSVTWTLIKSYTEEMK